MNPELRLSWDPLLDSITYAVTAMGDNLGNAELHFTYVNQGVAAASVSLVPSDIRTPLPNDRCTYYEHISPFEPKGSHAGTVSSRDHNLDDAHNRIVRPGGETSHAYSYAASR